MPNYWLLKTDPDTYSYEDLEREQKAVWDGVTNNLALKNIRNISKGDLAFIYHTGDDKAIVGIAEIVSGPYPDPKKGDPKIVVIDIRPQRRLNRPIRLEQIKGLKDFSNFDLVRLPRLSVMPVTATQWKHLLGLEK